MDRQSNSPYELESLFLLRLPPDAAANLHDVVLAGNLRDRISLNIHDDMRHGAVKFDGETFSGKIWDLPCIIECHKTVDMKTFYKVNDMCQILVCTPDPDLVEHEMNIQQATKSSYGRERKYLWPHGITPPLKNVRKRRFRKTAKKKYIDSPDIEKEVKRLLKADIEAVSVRYEIVNEEEKADEKAKGSQDSGQSLSLETDELHKIFQDLSSSDDEDEEVNVEDVDDSFASISIPNDIPLARDKGEIQRLRVKLDHLTTELAELRKRKERKKHLIRGQITNELLKAKFQGELEVVTARVTDTMREILITKAKLGMTDS